MLASASGQSGKPESVVATGQALSIAQRLLGVRSLQDVLPAEADEAPVRPQGLGLGAKYLPHSKVCLSGELVQVFRAVDSAVKCHMIFWSLY